MLYISGLTNSLPPPSLSPALWLTCYNKSQVISKPSSQRTPGLLWAHTPLFSFCETRNVQWKPDGRLLCLSYQAWNHFLLHSSKIKKYIDVVAQTLNIQSSVRDFHSWAPSVAFDSPKWLLSALHSFSNSQEFSLGKDLA